MEMPEFFGVSKIAFLSMDSADLPTAEISFQGKFAKTHCRIVLKFDARVIMGLVIKAQNDVGPPSSCNDSQLLHFVVCK